MRRTLLSSIAVLTALAVAALLTLVASPSSAAPEGSRWGANYFPNLSVVTHEGKTLRFYDDLIKDKIVVINFIYASCSDTCPLQTARMAMVQERLSERVGRDIFIYSITLDPENDSPEVLKKHAEIYNVGPGWLFLTGTPKELGLIRYKLGERSRSLNEHNVDIVLGNDATGEWTKTSTFADLERIVVTIKEMDPKWRAQERKVVSDYQNARYLDLGGQPGQGLFLKACAACHTIGKGVRVGPDLKGVTARRERAWLYRFMTAPEVMRAQQDPIALELAATFDGAQMPNLGLSETDVTDLLTYLDAQSKRSATQAGTTHSHKHDHQQHKHN